MAGVLVDPVRDRMDVHARRGDARQPPGSADPAVPTQCLGIPKGASPVDVETAYREALAKLDPELVSGLGADLQDHFRKKGEAVQRAYEMLATSGSG